MEFQIAGHTKFMGSTTKNLITVNLIFFILFLSEITFSQNAVSPYTNHFGQLNYSSLDSWYSRKVKESSILSGETKYLYELGKVDSFANFYDLKLKDKTSPWGTTNIYTKMFFDIGNTRVFPEKRDSGYCCRLETRIRKDNILGLKVEVLIAGTLFLGEMIEPVRNMKDPIKKVSQGVPFNRTPKAIKFDYKYKVGTKLVKATKSVEPIEGIDKAEFCMILQKRWEDENGNVFATRIGAARHFFTGTQNEWVNDSVFQITYGDFTKLPNYDAKTMGLIPEVSEVYVKNSKNKMVSLTETGWGNKEDTPTHLILYFTSSYQGVDYVGSPETVFWVDNIEFIY